MTLSLFVSMAGFALAASISPGPVNVVCLSCGTRFPLRVGILFATGASCGFLALFLAVGFGLHSLLEMFPVLNEVIRWGGVLFLLYLSFRLATDSGRVATDSQSAGPGFATGALMQWLNPKAWLAAASGIGANTAGADTDLLLKFAALYAPICWLSLSSWVLIGAFLKRHVQRPSLMRRFNQCLAALLVVSSVVLIFG